MSVSAGSNLQALLDQAVELLNNLDAGFAGEADNLGQLRQRLAEGRFHLAVLGQFKRGKSTLLNALLGEAVLPTSVIPLTAIPVFIQAGPALSARVLFEDDKPALEHVADDAGALVEFLSQYVTETRNPANRLGVRQVEVIHPAEILNGGVVLIDTPGIGSTFRHNTETTLNFLPQCDAAVFLVSADPPITEVEIEFLKQVVPKVPRLFFILNKADYLTEAERQEMLTFLGGVLTERLGVEGKPNVFCVSARFGLDARRHGDDALWARSGLGEVEAYLVDFLANEKTQALCRAVRMKAADVLAAVLMQVQLTISSLGMPLEDLEKRLAVFRKKLAELDRSKLSEVDLLEGDKKRTHEFLEEHAEQLRRKSRLYLTGVVEEMFARLHGEDINEGAVEQALAQAIPGFFEREMGHSTGVFQEKMREVLGPHRTRLNELVLSIRRAAAELFDVPCLQTRSIQDFEVVRRPYWVSHRWASSFQRIPRGLFDKLLPAGFRKSQLTRRAAGQIDELVMQNVENLRWAVYQNIDQSFVRYHSQLKRQLEQTLAATQGAIEAAMKKRKEHSEIVAAELSRLDTAVMLLTDIREALADEETAAGPAAK
ncbi:MAG TPA: Dynamin family protein [Phycisphaerales bacterium]|nr:Dynamin family protein [Phycisphaerales bacterium]